MKYFAVISGKHTGPLTIKDLHKMALSGVITKETMLFEEGSDTRLNAGDLEGLFDKPAIGFSDIKFTQAKRLLKNKWVVCGIILSILIGLVLLGLFHKRHKDNIYKENVEDVYNRMLLAVGIAERVIGHIKTSWQEGIFVKHDANISDVVVRAQEDKHDDIAGLQKILESIELKMKAINDPPAAHKHQHEKLLEFYKMVSRFCSYATNPSGSFLTFNGDTSKDARDILSAKKELDLFLAP